MLLDAVARRATRAADVEDAHSVHRSGQLEDHGAIVERVVRLSALAPPR
jgi:hypothetical protein